MIIKAKFSDLPNGARLLDWGVIMIKIPEFAKSNGEIVNAVHEYDDHRLVFLRFFQGEMVELVV